jgi:hypothetical protein
MTGLGTLASGVTVVKFSRLVQGGWIRTKPEGLPGRGLGAPNACHSCRFISIWHLEARHQKRRLSRHSPTGVMSLNIASSSLGDG